MKKLLLLFIVPFLLSSCDNGKVSKREINRFIERFDNEDFSDFTGLLLFIRSQDRTGKFIFLKEMIPHPRGHRIGYYKKEKSVRIDRDTTSVKLSELTDDEIKKMIYKFVEYKVTYLGVDSIGNVYINPYDMEHPFYLRMNTGIEQKPKRGYIHCKDNWYIAARYLK